VIANIHLGRVTNGQNLLNTRKKGLSGEELKGKAASGRKKFSCPKINVQRNRKNARLRRTTGKTIPKKSAFLNRIHSYKDSTNLRATLESREEWRGPPEKGKKRNHEEVPRRRSSHSDRKKRMQTYSWFKKENTYRNYGSLLNPIKKKDDGLLVSSKVLSLAHVTCAPVNPEKRIRKKEKITGTGRRMKDQETQSRYKLSVNRGMQTASEYQIGDSIQKSASPMKNAIDSHQKAPQFLNGKKLRAR